MIVGKIHRTYRNVVALCDADLLGKYFEEGKLQLDLRGHFFKGRELTHEETVTLIQDQAKEDATFNIVGEKAINAAVEAGIIEDNSVGRVGNIPFTLILT